MKLLNSGHLRVMKSLSVIKKCPLLGGSLTAIVTFGTKHFVCYWRHVCYFGCPLWRAFTVIIIKITIPVLNNDTVLKYCKIQYHLFYHIVYIKVTTKRWAFTLRIFIIFIIISKFFINVFFFVFVELIFSVKGYVC